MVKGILKGVVFFAFVLLFISFISASATLGKTKYFIEKSYGPGNEISGWLNISLDAEPANSVFTGSFGNEDYTINLLSLIRKNSNSNFEYTCDTFNCSSSYVGSNAESSKVFTLEKSKVIGFKINEKKEVSDFSKFSLTITSDSTIETNDNPLSIDILNDNKEEWIAHAPSESFNSPNYGCYDNTHSPRIANIPTEDRYCERMKLSKSPSVKIGANITGEADGKFTMSIEDMDGNSESCTATSIAGVKEVSCVPEFAIQTAGNYFVCIIAEQPNYQINFVNTNPYPCGFSGDFDGEYTSDFEIFAQTNKYAPIGTVVLNNEESELSTGEEINIEAEIEDYIYERYNNNCSKDCIIPIKISGTTQGLIVDDAELSYQTDEIEVSADKSLYDLSETPTKITAGFQKLNLEDAKFLTPNSYKNYTFSLSLGNLNLLSEKIAVERGPVIRYVTPASTAVTYPTEFKVALNKTGNITRYSWDFGDGTKQNTTTNKATYTYDTAGIYELKVIVTDSNDRSSSKRISINVKPASEMVPVLFNNLKEDIGKIKVQIISLNLSNFEKESLNSSLRLNEMDEIITGLQTIISQASSEEQFEAILGQIVSLRIPKNLEKTASLNNGIFYSEAANIDLATLEMISKTNYTISDEEAYKNAIIAWEEENIETTFTFRELSATYDDYTAPFLKTFEMDIKKNSGTPYLIIKSMENLLFGADYGEQLVGDYVYILLDNPEEKIIFSTTEDNIDFTTLPVFISPDLSELTIIEGETITPFEEGKMVLRNPGLFFTIVIIVLLGAFIIWVLLQIWYVRRYEQYLFKNRNNLYNIINYINTAKKSGSNDKEITSKLKKAGWTYEQLQYALNKYAGKKSLFQQIFMDKKLINKTVKSNNP